VEKFTAKQIESVLLGVAVGDALGVPFEFLPRGTFIAVDMAGHGTHDQPIGTWSDDTSLTLCLAWAMSKHWDTENILNETALSFLRWRDDTEFTAHGAVFDVGNATSRAINKLRKGVPPTGSGGDTVKDNGNGSLMRIAPIAFFVAGRPQAECFDIVRKVSSITHAHPISVLSCIIYVEYLLKLLQSSDKFAAFEATRKEIMDALMKGALNNYYRNEITDYFMPLIFPGNKWHTFEKSDIKSGGFVADTLKASIRCFIATENYRDAVLEAVNLGEDTDTTAAVTGGLAGAYYGFDNNGIPPEWIKALAKHETISDIAKGVFASSKNP
jgi:ADP-ribosylglycohydrolase